VKAPLVEAGLTKAEIRELSRRASLPTWDRPAAACLSSRVPYGTPVTVAVLLVNLLWVYYRVPEYAGETGAKLR